MTNQKFASLLLATALLALSGCGGPDYATLQGTTMGTYYSVRYHNTGECLIERAGVEEVLDRVNGSMSTYDVESELSLFNRSTGQEWIPVSAELATVIAAAEQMWRLSGGGFDVTVGPLVNLWGFGASSGNSTVEDRQIDSFAQEAAAANVGMQHLETRFTASAAGAGPSMRKHIPDLYVDLSALAKGFAVDEVSELLHQLGCPDHMVDIGGELQLAGVNPAGGDWRIGVERPDPARMGAVQRVLALRDTAVATSGDYRNFRVVDGRRIDHVFDPRSGQPASNQVVSVTVLHESAMWADAWATTIMVLGEEEGLALAQASGVAAYVLMRGAPVDGEGGEEALREGYNQLMSAYLQGAADRDK